MTSLVPSPLPAAILQWPEKVVWRLWSTFLDLEASSDYVTLVGTARCEICTGKMEVPRCAVCFCSVANPSFCRRIESSPKVFAFAKCTVGLRIAETESSNQYVCQTCFSKLEKGSKAEGRVAKQRDLPVPVGRKTKTSRPFKKSKIASS